MLTVLRQRNFALLWLGQMVSVAGDYVLYAALPFFVYDRTGSALAAGGMFMTLTLPFLLFGTVAGVFADRWDRRRTMIASDLLRAAVLLPLLLIRGNEWLWLLYAVAFIESSFGQFFLPAKNALLPRLVKKEDLFRANSLSSFGENLARLVGPSLGGLLMATLGLTAVVLLDAATYLLSGLLIYAITVPPGTPDARKKDDPASAGTRPGVWRDWLEGLRLMKTHRLLRGLFVSTGIALVGDGMFSALLVIFVKDVLAGDSREFGWLLTARGMGGLAGTFLLGWLGNRIAPTRLVPLGMGVTGLFLLGMVDFPSLGAAVTLIVLAGIGATAWLIGNQTLLQTRIGDSHRGRVFGIFGTLAALATLTGMGLGSVLAEWIDVVIVLNFAAGLMLAAGGLGALLLGHGKQAGAEVDANPVAAD